MQHLSSFAPPPPHTHTPVPSAPTPHPFPQANFPLPPAVQNHDACRELMQQPTMKAGDVLLFSEACSHGALPWTAAHERRAVLYRFSPPTVAYGRGVYELPEAVLADCTPAERAVLQPPFNNRVDRLWPAADGSDEAREGTARDQRKKDFDQAVFGHQYF